MTQTPLSSVSQASKSITHQHPTNVLQISHNLTIGETLHALSLYGVLSAPVVVLTSLEDLPDSSPYETLVGWVSVADICRGLVSDPSLNLKGHGSMLSVMSALDKTGNKYFDRPIITLTDSGDKELMFVSDASAASVLDACLMLVGEKGVEKGHARHRIGIFDSHGSIIQVISQQDLVSFLHKNVALFGSIASKSIDELGLASVKPDLFTLVPSTLTIDAIIALTNKGLSGAPITDQSVPIAHFSLSDLRGITRSHLGVLSLPLGEFVALKNGTSFLGNAQPSNLTSGLHLNPFFESSNKGMQPGVPNIKVTKHTTFSETLGLLSESKVHRVSVVDRNGKIESLISLTDILAFATKT